MTAWQIHQGDCIEQMRKMADGSVNCCITSPPYYGLRDYGKDGQIGLEATPDEYVAKMVEVFREVKRVLRDDGTVWLNLGDSYVGATSQHKDGGSQGENSCIAKKTMSGIPSTGRGDRNRLLYDSGLKMKQLIGIPWRVAFALQSDGWYLRQDIIWHKPNPMPESVTDRCTKAHEYVFLLSKSQKYYYDADAVREPLSESTKNDPRMNDMGRKYGGKGRGAYNETGLANGSMATWSLNPSGRNKRSVWTVATQPYKEAHFAVFPPKLIEPCVLAGCPVGGTILDPFTGSGTTGQVSVENGRNFVGCELNPEYIALAEQRIGHAASQTVMPFLFEQPTIGKQ